MLGAVPETQGLRMCRSCGRESKVAKSTNRKFKKKIFFKETEFLCEFSVLNLTTNSILGIRTRHYLPEKEVGLVSLRLGGP